MTPRAPVALICGALLSCAASPERLDPVTVSARCRMDVAPQVIARDGDATLWRWEQDDKPVFEREVLPVSEALSRYREAFLDLPREQWRAPISDVPRPEVSRMREIWRREFINRDVARSGRAGLLRPMRCLEALAFAHQAERAPPLEQPTEFIAAVLKRPGAGRLRVYVGASSSRMFPPKSVYPFAHVARDVKAGWTFSTLLHNHTPQTYKGRRVLGWPAPSTQDVALSRSLVASSGLRSIQVTNGFYTVEIPAAALSSYEGPPP